MENKDRYEHYYEMIEEGLSYYLPNTSLPQTRLFDAIRYSLIGGGKKLRGMLVLEFCRVCGGDLEKALPFACAAEMIHTYSLIHDDLPCMDNDDMRRGRPTNHKVFGECMAVLAGDALLNAAFETMLDIEYVKNIPPEAVFKAAHRLARAAGPYGMIGGQALDMQSEGENLPIEEIKMIYGLKTGALITACAEAGCIIAGAPPHKIAAASNFAQCFGLAFQIKDDLLDVVGDPEKTGKSTGGDAERDKPTFVKMIDITECEKTIKTLTSKAEMELSVFEDNKFLLWLTRLMSERHN